MLTEHRKARLKMKALLYGIDEEKRREYRRWRTHWFYRLSPAEHEELQRYIDSTPKVERYRAEYELIKWFLKLSPERIEEIHTELDAKYAQLTKTEQRRDNDRQTNMGQKPTSLIFT